MTEPNKNEGRTAAELEAAAERGGGKSAEETLKEMDTEAKQAVGQAETAEAVVKRRAAEISLSEKEAARLKTNEEKLARAEADLSEPKKTPWYKRIFSREVELKGMSNEEFAKQTKANAPIEGEGFKKVENKFFEEAPKIEPLTKEEQASHPSEAAPEKATGPVKALSATAREARRELDELWDDFTKEFNPPKYEVAGNTLASVKKLKKPDLTAAQKSERGAYRELGKKGGTENLSTKNFAELEAAESRQRFTDAEYEKMKSGEIPWKMNAVWRAIGEMDSGKFKTPGTKAEVAPKESKKEAAIETAAVETAAVGVAAAGVAVVAEAGAGKAVETAVEKEKEIKVGDTVKVLRSDGTVESGWLVTGVKNGMVEVSKPDKEYEKTHPGEGAGLRKNVPADQLKDWQRLEAKTPAAPAAAEMSKEDHAKLKELEKAFDEIETQENAIRSDLNSLTEASRSRNIGERKARLEAMLDLLAKVDQQSASAEDQAKTPKAYAEEVRAIYEGFKDNIQKVNFLEFALKNAIDTLNKKQSELLDKMQAAGKEIGEFKKTRGAVPEEEPYENYEVAATTKSAEQVAREKRIKAMEAEMKAASKEMTESAAAIANLKDELAELKPEFDQLEKDSKKRTLLPEEQEAVANYRNMQAELVSLSAERASADSRLSELQKERDAAMAEAKKEEMENENIAKEFPPGAVVKVMRSDGTVEADWLVTGVKNGTVEVSKPDKEYEKTHPGKGAGVRKSVPPDQLKSWQSLEAAAAKPLADRALGRFAALKAKEDEKPAAVQARAHMIDETKTLLADEMPPSPEDVVMPPLAEEAVVAAPAEKAEVKKAKEPTAAEIMDKLGDRLLEMQSKSMENIDSHSMASIEEGLKTAKALASAKEVRDYLKTMSKEFGLGSAADADKLSDKMAEAFKERLVNYFEAQIDRKKSRTKPAAAEAPKSPEADKEAAKQTAIAEIKGQLEQQHKANLRHLDETSVRATQDNLDYLGRLDAQAVIKTVLNGPRFGQERIDQLDAKDIIAIRDFWIEKNKEALDTLVRNKKNVKNAFADLDRSHEEDMAHLDRISLDDIREFTDRIGKTTLEQTQSARVDMGDMTAEDAQTLTRGDLEKIHQHEVDNADKLRKAWEAAHADEVAAEKEKNRPAREANRSVVGKLNEETLALDDLTEKDPAAAKAELTAKIAEISGIDSTEARADYLTAHGFIKPEERGVLNEERINYYWKDRKTTLDGYLKEAEHKLAKQPAAKAAETAPVTPAEAPKAPEPKVDAKKEKEAEIGKIMAGARETIKATAEQLAKADLSLEEVDNMAALVREIDKTKKLGAAEELAEIRTNLTSGDKPYLTQEAAEKLSGKDLRVLRDEIKAMYGAEIKRRDAEAAAKKKAVAEAPKAAPAESPRAPEQPATETPAETTPTAPPAEKPTKKTIETVSPEERATAEALKKRKKKITDINRDKFLKTNITDDEKNTMTEDQFKDVNAAFEQYKLDVTRKPQVRLDKKYLDGVRDKIKKAMGK